MKFNNQPNLNMDNKYYDNRENSDYNARIKSLRTYEDWKSAKKKRKTWINLIVLVGSLLLAYITICLVSRCGIGNVWKTFKYASTNIETKTQREQIPTDYLTFYKEKKMDQAWAHKKFGHLPSPYFTYEEIAKREAKKTGEDWFGELGGKLAEWWVSKGIDESKKKEVDYIAYANEVYSNAAFIVNVWGFLLFYIIYGIVLAIVLYLSWREPKLEA